MGQTTGVDPHTRKNKEMLPVRMLPNTRTWYLGIAALLVTDHHERRAVDAADATYNRRVVQTSTVSVKLYKLVGDVQDDI